MPTIREVLRNIRLLLTPRAVERDLDDGLRTHLDLQTRLNIERGMDPTSARDQAERDFGPIASVKEALRNVHGQPSAPLRDTLGGDLHFAIRSLARHRVFSGVTIFVLTLGIAATTLMFSVVSGILLKPLPFGHPEQIVLIWGSLPVAQPRISAAARRTADRKTPAAWPAAVPSISAFVSQLYNIGSTTSPERLNGTLVTSEFFSTIGVRPALGRAFSHDEEAPGKDHVVVLSDGHCFSGGSAAIRASSAAPSRSTPSRTPLSAWRPKASRSRAAPKCPATSRCRRPPSFGSR